MTAVASSSSCGGCCGLELFFGGGGNLLLHSSHTSSQKEGLGHGEEIRQIVVFALSHFVLVLCEFFHIEITIYFCLFFWQIPCPPKRAVRRGGKAECLLACPQSPPRPIQLGASLVPTPKTPAKTHTFPQNKTASLGI